MQPGHTTGYILQLQTPPIYKVEVLQEPILVTIAEASIQRGILQRVCKLLDKQVPAHEVSSAPDELRLGTAAFRARQKPQMP